MLGGLESGFGLDVVVWLQGHSNVLLDVITLVLHVVGYGFFYVVVVFVAFRHVDRQLGVRLLFAWLLTVIAFEVLKRLFHTPRPYVAYPEQVTPMFEQGGFGLPSGHVTSALVMWGYIALWLRRRRVWALVGLYVLLMGWSRMYAGVHYPQDVVAGLILGALLLWLYNHLIRLPTQVSK